MVWMDGWMGCVVVFEFGRIGVRIWGVDGGGWMI